MTMLELMHLSVPKVLIVDDTAFNHTVYSHILGNLAVEIHNAYSKDEAVELCTDHSFALILLDVIMPNEDGFETAKHLKETQNASSTPIIFVSEKAVSNINHLQGYMVGAFDYIAKPIDPIILKNKVGCFIDLYQTREMDLLHKIEQTKNAIMDNISHQFRSPTHYIQNYCEMLLNDWDNITDDEKKEYALNILENCKRLQTYDDNITRLHQLHNGEIEFSIKPHIFGEIVSEVIAIYQQKLPDIDIEFENPSDNITVYCDGYFIRIVIDNLLQNAVLYGKKKPITISIDMTNIPNERNQYSEAIAFTIKDQGIGIPKDELVHIFGRFNESSLTQCSSGGTGLGLSICHKIIHNHHGTIWAESNEGDGATFTFTLPLDMTSTD